MTFTKQEIESEICKILLELSEDPKFSYEDCAAAIHERIFLQFKSHVLANFTVSQEAYERKHC